MGEVKIDIEEKIRVNKLDFKLPTHLRELLDGFKWAINNKNQSAVMIVDGRSGMGKTTLSFQCAKYISPNFSLDDVYFSPDKFLEGLSNTKKGARKTLVFDEAMMLSSRAALSAMNKMIVVAMSMIRSKNVFIIFNVNSIFDLDKNLALSRADLLLHCYGESLTDKGKFLAFFRGSDGRDRIKELYLNGKKLYSYSNPKSNFNTVFTEYFVLNEEEYEEKKQKEINLFLKGGKNKAETRTHMSRDRYIAYLYNQCDLMKKDIAKIGDLDLKTVYTALKRSKDNGLVFKELEEEDESELDLQEDETAVAHS